MPEVPSFPWWYLAKQSAIMNGLCLVLGAHLNDRLTSPLTAIKRDEMTIKALTDTDQFLKRCLSTTAKPEKADNEALFDLHLAHLVLFNCQKELGIRLVGGEKEFREALERYSQLLEKIINYDSDKDKIDNENVLFLIKFFNAMAQYIHIKICALHRLIMASQ